VHELAKIEEHNRLSRPYINKELELLLCGSRANVDAKRAGRIRDLAGSGLDWDYLLKSASQHGIVPLLYHSLKKTAPDAVPPAVRSEL
jgi:hypothetical protein